MITQSHLREILYYSIITGQFYWLMPMGGRAKVAHIAGTSQSGGYRQIRINGRPYLAHRLAWLWVTGVWPVNEIDHINGFRDANCWLNLREATHSQNQHNKGMLSNNTSGFKGVRWDEARQKWRSYIKLNKKEKHLGCYDDIELAYAARLKAEKQLHGEFARC